MEKEADISLSRFNRIQLYHPVLKNKIDKVRQDLFNSIKTSPVKFKKMDLYNKINLIKTFLQEGVTFKEYVKELYDDVPLNKVPNLILENEVFLRVLEQTKIKEIPCTCKDPNKPALLKIIKTGIGTKNVICYNNCAQPLYAAFKRALKSVPLCSNDTFDEFINFSKRFIDDHMDKYFKNFGYSYAQWFNHLPGDKKRVILKVEDKIKKYTPDKYPQFDLFCKREIQEEGGKNRAIAAINAYTKYIMGPVTWALESLFSKHFPGYCGNKNFEELEKLFSKLFEKGFYYVLQGDGSGFDLSQNYKMKEIDKYIYNKIAHKIYHVQPDLFIHATNTLTKTLKAVGFKPGMNIGTANIVGTVFSGSSDTTLMNTIRMSLYNHFTMYKIGLQLGIDYQLLSKGDDFMVFVRDGSIDYEKEYYKYWLPKNNYLYTSKPYGIGQILKFLKIGSYSEIDFCSTTCIPIDAKGHYKLARKPDRLNPLAHFSRKAVYYTPGQLKQYLLDQAYALEFTMKNTFFYHFYVTAYNYMANIISAIPKRINKYKKVPPPKPPDGHPCVGDDNDRDIRFDCYGYSFSHGLKFRGSNNKMPDDQRVICHMLTHFGILPSTLRNYGNYLLNSNFTDKLAFQMHSN